MKELFGILVGFVLLVSLVFGMAWVVEGNDLFLYQYFAPRRAEVERKVFENTPSYNRGMIQELQNMQFEYTKATTPEAKQAMASIILHRAADIDADKLPVDLREFIRSLQIQQNYQSAFNK